MYFQIYDRSTGRTLFTCPTAEDAHKLFEKLSDPSLQIRAIAKSEHPLARNH